LISDTHGLLRAEAIAYLQGCDHIIHGGDIGAPDIIEKLAELAPVTAVCGNNDAEPWAQHLPGTQLLKFADVSVYVLHNLAELAMDPVAAGVDVVVSGHSHKPLVRESGGVCYVNPGSAGPRRFKLPISIGQLSIRGGTATAEIVELKLG
jgi:putative phosphoesterase